MVGRLDEAAAYLTQATVLKRDDAAANLGLADVLAAQGKLDEARSRYERALVLDPRLADAHHGLAYVLMQQGHLDQSVAHYRRTLALKPDYAEACSNLGIALASQGSWDEAAALYRRALALKPELIDVYRSLARLMLMQGEAAEALAIVGRALAVGKTEEAKLLFVECVKNLRTLPGDDDLRGLIARALAEGWSRPSELSAVAGKLVKRGVAGGTCVERAAKAWPRRLAAQDLWGPDGLAALAADRLLRALLESAPARDIELERFLTQARTALLELAMGSDATSAVEEDALGFFCALARQCFINEYVFAATEDEVRQAAELEAALAAAIESSAPVPALRLVAVAAYRPLHALGRAVELLERSWPPPIGALLDQQVREPLAERQISGSIPALTSIDDEISLLVRRQYEDMPYPRWVKAAPTGKPIAVDWYLRNQFPMAPIRNLGRLGSLDMLIAGCGTGQHAIESAQRFLGARVLAIDLSRTSLGYAKRKTRELSLRNIDYAQADILKLGSLGRSFDVIEASGVLHHLGDPAAGWRVLAALLRPGGFMHVGLYSALARADIRAARAFIAERGYGRTASDIRQCRQDLMSFEDGTPLKNVTKYPDFFTTSECRDLLFHVQEHQFTIADIKAFLIDNDLAFLGFTGPAVQDYRRRHPGEEAMTDLDQWHVFETENPMAFTGMYQFWVQKRG